MTVFIRIGLRYVAALLVARGLLDPGMGDMLANDPDLLSALQVLAGVAAALVAEGWYWLAKRLGWAT
ncbi:MAG TPA: hypothetical protein VNS12_13675 [Pelagibacterium sp.]|uniref:Pam3-gp28 family putative phage holin n=1 Tax=Pelagibacterium sp. TaxID=1967288 RepID=UPI002C75752D|nr:hypothetical protein [Pelagibacterium sp.]HWJ89112.1 hypothetical protein [Pelagibacterium sp.]